MCVVRTASSMVGLCGLGKGPVRVRINNALGGQPWLSLCVCVAAPRMRTAYCRSR